MAGFDGYSEDDWEKQAELEFLADVLKEAERRNDVETINTIRRLIAATLLFMKGVFGKS